MKKVEKCQWCLGTNVKLVDNYEDWDDVNDKEIIRAGYLCSDCGAFHYEMDCCDVLITPAGSGNIDFKEKSELLLNK